MDFEQAIASHLAWKTKLQLFLAHPEKPLDPEITRQDTHCELGAWLYGEGAQRYHSLPDFVALKTEHAKFHRAAARVVAEANARRMEQAEALLAAHGEYSELSANIVSLINRVRRHVEL